MRTLIPIAISVAVGTDSCWARNLFWLSDDELAQLPVVAVARWLPRDEARDKVGVPGASDGVEIEIIRPIRGLAAPGKRRVRLQRGIAWNRDGSQLRAEWSTTSLGDVPDVRAPSLWFLDESDETGDEAGVLRLPSVRAIQPLDLEGFYLGIRVADATPVLARLLRTANDVVCQRVLLYIAGGCMPWPYSDPTVLGERPVAASRFRVLAARLRSDLRAFLVRSGASLRGLALSVYAEGAGHAASGVLRYYLSDPDADTRLVAAAWLVRRREAGSIAEVAATRPGYCDPLLACRLCETVGCWGRVELAPLLFRLLGDDRLAYVSGEDIGVPAMKAREVLLSITGCVFPYDPALSAQVWSRVARIREPRSRQSLLSRVLPSTLDPIAAVAAPNAEGDDVVLRLRNQGVTPFSITREPAYVEARSSRGVTSLHPREALSAGDFVRLEPGNVTEVRIDSGGVGEGGTARALGGMEIRLLYSDLGKRFGVQDGWIGWVAVDHGGGGDVRAEDTGHKSIAPKP